MSRLRIAWLSYRPPFPPLKGDQRVTTEQIRRLADIYSDEIELHLLSLHRTEAERVAVEQNLGHCFTSMHWFKMSKLAHWAGLLRTPFNKAPMQVNYYTSEKNRREIRRTLARLVPDMIHTQTVRTGLYIPPEIPLTLDMLDLLSLNMRRRAEGERFPRRQIFSLEAALLRRYEETMYKRAGVTMLVSEKDKIAWGKPDVVVNPNGTFITPEYLARYSNVERKNAFVFHGGMSYFPNVQAALFLANEIWPAVHRVLPDWRLLIVGNNPSPEIRRLHGRSNIEVTGFVPDITETLCGCRIGAYPLLAGTGMLNKVLESMSVGIPLVATSRAMQGFPDREGDEALERDTAQAFGEAMVRLAKDEALRKKIGESGQRYAWSKYSWENNVGNLVDCWRQGVVSRETLGE
ncbi:MAG: glycosyltransferase family 4 protein [Candidatus Cloacimonetes bacterium]|nr:glycosyltransferase family 4 protein [Candidatus Cloacimonadota bacterium]